MTMGVAVDVHRHGKAGDMAGVGLHVDAQGGHVAAESGGADPEAVDPFREFFFQGGDVGVGVPRTHFAEEGLLGQKSGMFEVSAQTDADNEGRTGIGTRLLNRFENERAHSLPAVGRLEHRNFTPFTNF